ncbi:MULTISPECIES: hypothetical protein [Clostridium]|uniref:hypothetical protein n=1 Tax=Clostridium TaxID=1485 RepID=UPI000826F267|nr:MULTISPECIES: hypothetical protein [Clostridium]PJI10458.1 hypothetical protein CUB90_00230 [Clostridium sp. CT7]
MKRKLVSMILAVSVITAPFVAPTTTFAKTVSKQPTNKLSADALTTYSITQNNVSVSVDSSTQIYGPSSNNYLFTPYNSNQITVSWTGLTCNGASYPGIHFAAYDVNTGETCYSDDCYIGRGYAANGSMEITDGIIPGHTYRVMAQTVGGAAVVIQSVTVSNY